MWASKSNATFSLPTVQQDEALSRIEAIAAKLDEFDAAYKGNVKNRSQNEKNRREELHSLKKAARYYEKWSTTVDEHCNLFLPSIETSVRKELYVYLKNKAPEAISQMYNETENTTSSLKQQIYEINAVQNKALNEILPMLENSNYCDSEMIESIKLIRENQVKLDNIIKSKKKKLKK